MNPTKQKLHTIVPDYAMWLDMPKPWFEFTRTDIELAKTSVAISDTDTNNHATGYNVSPSIIKQLMFNYYRLGRQFFESLGQSLGCDFKLIGIQVFESECNLTHHDQTYYACDYTHQSLIVSNSLLSYFFHYAIGSKESSIQSLVMSPLEQRITGLLSDMIVTAFEPLIKLKQAPNTVLWEKLNATIEQPYICLNVLINGDIPATLGCCYDLKTLVAAAKAVVSQPQSKPSVILNKQAMTGITVELPVFLTHTTLRMKELTTVQAGDILPLDMTLDEPVSLRISDRDYATTLGKQHNKIAVMIQPQTVASISPKSLSEKEEKEEKASDNIPNSDGQDQVIPVEAPTEVPTEAPTESLGESHDITPQDDSIADPAKTANADDNASFSWDDIGGSMISSLQTDDNADSFWTEEAD